MKKHIPHLLAALLAVATAPAAFGAEKEITIRRAGPGPGHPPALRPAPHRAIRVSAGGEKVEMEKVAFLGVQAEPASRALAAQLGLPRGTGLVVAEIVPDSPAAAVLQEHDILTKLDDQILISQQQLSVLIRNRREGEEVTLTIYRAGKESTVRVKLGQREVPKMAVHEFPGADERGHFRAFGFEAPQIARLHQLPGMEAGQVRDVIRLIERNRGDLIEAPGVHVFRRGSKGATILDLPQGNVVYSDDAGSVEVKAEDGKRQLTVKDASGKVLFEGPVNSREDREKLPPEVKERLGKIEGAEFSSEIGEGFEAEGADLRPGVGLRRIGLPRGGAVHVRRHAPRFF